MTTTTTPKRKAVDQVNYDFSDFSLSSPATKIRRLDYGELAPIMEEDEQGEEEESHMCCSCSCSEEETSIISNEERAIVLFNPRPSLSLDSSPHTLSLTPHMLSSLKVIGQQRLWSKQSNLLNHSSEDKEDDVVVSNQCLAVVPWVYSRLSPPPPVEQEDAPETMMMEAQQLNEQDFTMDIEPPLEQHYAATGSIQHTPPTTTETSNQWQLQQQHCMVPSQLLPRNASATAAPAPTPTPTPVWFH